MHYGILGHHIYLYKYENNDRGYCTQLGLTQKHTATGQLVNPVEGMRGSEAGKRARGRITQLSFRQKNSSLASPQQFSLSEITRFISEAIRRINYYHFRHPLRGSKD
ncbi:hypothetical protein TNCV_1605511 [Trichonephila clavipes]|nr:hypothetical protein TNCV_1605511 [Trichonephila clavipes]